MKALFQEALERIEMLPDYQQEDLIEIIKARLRDRRRERLLDEVEISLEEYKKGEVQKGSVDDLMDAL